MEKVSRMLKRTIAVVFVAVYFLILGIDILGQGMDYCCKKEFALPNWCLVILGLGLVLCMAGFLKNKKDWLERKLSNSDRWILILSVLLFFVQVFITYCIIFRTSWDAGIVSAQARLAAKHSSEIWSEYYSMHQNNLLITFVYSFFYWISGIVANDSYGVILIAVTQCLLSTIAGYLVYKIARRAGMEKLWSMVAWIIFVLWVGMSPWKVIPYSDSFGILFPILVLWLYQLPDNKKYFVIKCVSIGVISAVSYYLKPTIVFVFLAILIVELVHLFEKAKRSDAIKKIGIFLVSFLLATLLYNSYDMAGAMGMEIEEEKAFGMAHYLMLGFREDTNGVYSGEDENFSMSFDTKKERNAANMEMIKKRIKDFGVTGLMKHYVKKSLTNFNDGTFTWGWDGNFYAGIIEEPDHIVSPILRSFYYDSGALSFLFWILMQFWWLIVIMGFIAGGMDVIKHHTKSDLELVMLVALMGLTVFVMLFEGRGRYLYIYSPIYILVSVYGYRGCVKAWKGKKL